MLFLKGSKISGRIESQRSQIGHMGNIGSKESKKSKGKSQNAKACHPEPGEGTKES
jgi:hypothetical protein